MPMVEQDCRPAYCQNDHISQIDQDSAPEPAFRGAPSGLSACIPLPNEPNQFVTWDHAAMTMQNFQ